MSYGVRIVLYLLNTVLLTSAIIYHFTTQINDPKAVKINNSTELLANKNHISGTMECNDKISMFNTEFLQCLQSIDDPELLNRERSEDVNVVDQCRSTLNRESNIGNCYFGSDYQLIEMSCGHLVLGIDQQDFVSRSISQFLCVQEHEFLIGSGDAIINFRKQIDGSSFVTCSNNNGCPDDEFCTIQSVKRCEKIIRPNNNTSHLVNAMQMRQIIKDNCDNIKSGADTHSRINPLMLNNGQAYIVKNVSVLGLINQICPKESIKNIQQFIE